MASNRRSSKGAAAPAQFRLNSLARACVLATGAVVATGAVAQSSSVYDQTLNTPTTTYSWNAAPGFAFWITAPQYNNGTIIPQVGNSSVGTSTTQAGSGTNTYNSSSNSVTATGIGNTQINSIPTGLLAGGGLGIRSSQINGGDAAASTGSVSTTVGTGVIIGVNTIDEASASNFTVNSNRIAASTTLNAVDSAIAGALTGPYVSATDGVASGSFIGATGVLTTTSTGALSISNAQTALNSSSFAGSDATVTGSQVRLLAPESAVAYSQAIAMSSNTIDATFGANAASNVIQATPTANAFTGATSIVNAQMNIETVGASGPTAVVTNSGISADIRFNDGATTTQAELQAGLTLSSNHINATSTGNNAGAGTSAGNLVLFQSPSASYTGAGSVASNVLTIPNDNVTMALGADVAIASGQGNVGTNLQSTVTGTVANPGIVARADNMSATGSISVLSNTINSAATGNTAGNWAIAETGQFNATVAVGSAQANDATTITAATSTVTIAGQTGAQAGASVNQGDATVSSNKITSTATGSDNTSGVSITADSIVALPAAGSGSVLTYPGGFGDSRATAAMSVNTIQGNHGAATIQATTTNATITANSQDTAAPAPAPTNVAVTGVQFRATGNEITAAATGNTNTGSLNLTADTATTTGAVASTQFNNNTIVSGVSGASGVGITVGVATNSTLEIIGTQVKSTTTGNDTTQSIGLGVTSLTAGPAAFTATPSATVLAGGSGVTTNGAFTVSSAQSNETAATTASAVTDTAFAQVQAGVTGTGGVAGTSDLSVLSTNAQALATVNKSNNSLHFGSGSVTTSDGSGAQLGVVANSQINTAASSDSATVGRTAAGQVIGITYLEAVTGGALSVTGNNLEARAVGNDTSNRLTSTLSSYQPTANASNTGLVTSTAATAAGVTSVTHEFSLLNRQTTTGGTLRESIVQNGIIGVDDSGAIQSMAGTVNVTGNTLKAASFNNNAGNLVSIGAGGGVTTDLATSAGLMSQQLSTVTDTEATIGGSVRVLAGSGVPTLVSGNISLNGNLVTGQAVGNYATNGLVAQGVNVTGNANVAMADNGVGLSAGALTVGADFGLGNVQSHTGIITAGSLTSVRGELTGSDVTSPTLEMAGNMITMVGQSNSAINELVLAGAPAVGAGSVTGTAAIGSTQTASGNVTVTHAAPAGERGTFLITNDTANGIDGSTVRVTGNEVKTFAGQNEAINALNISATSVTGTGPGTNVSTATGATPRANADYVILNVQSATAGNVVSTVNPGAIGVQANNINGITLWVTGNRVEANSGINSSSNSLNLNLAETTNALNATSAVVNQQSNAAAQAVTSTVGSTPGLGTVVLNVGISAPTNGTTVNDILGSTLHVSGNVLQAQALGNNTVNSATAAAASTLQLAATGQTVAVLNTQTNNAALTATTQNAAIGMNPGALNGGGVSGIGTSLNVTGNEANAIAGGNTAANTLTATTSAMLSGPAGPAPNYLLNNEQTNAVTGVVNANVTSVDIGSSSAANAGAGIVAGTLTGPIFNNLSNKVLASGYGNTATNIMNVTGLSGTAALASGHLTSTQVNSAAINATVTSANIGNMNGVVTTGSFTVTGNSIAATATGNSAVNRIQMK